MNSILSLIAIALLLLLAVVVAAFLHWLRAGLSASSSFHDARPPIPVHPRRIIVPLLDSATWREAASVACDLATEHGAEILLVHVLEIPWTLGLDVPLPEAEEKARALLETARSVVAHRNLEVRSRILRHRSAAEAIVELARAMGAEVIVTASGASPWWSRARLGRTVSGLLRYAPAQVVVVRVPRPL